MHTLQVCTREGRRTGWDPVHIDVSLEYILWIWPGAMPPPKPPSSFQNQDEANGNQSCPAPWRVFNCKTNYSELEMKAIDELINCLFQMTTYGKTEKILCKQGRKTCWAEAISETNFPLQSVWIELLVASTSWNSYFNNPTTGFSCHQQSIFHLNREFVELDGRTDQTSVHFVNSVTARVQQCMPHRPCSCLYWWCQEC